jgi:hypothetical protein
MNTKNIVAILAAMGAVSGAGIAWWSHRTTLDLERESTTLAKQRAALAITARHLEGQIATSQREHAELGHSNDPARVTPRPATNAAAPVADNPRNNPELQARALETFKAGLLAKYAAFYRAVGLTAERAARFEALLLEHEGRQRDIIAAETTVRIDPATAETREAVTVDGRRVAVLVDPAIAALRRVEDARFKADEIALLGESGYAQLQAYDGMAESRGVVSELVRNLSLGPALLSVEQGEQMVAILQGANYHAKLAPENNRWDEIIQRAQGVLAPPQAGEFDALIEKLRRDAARNPLQRAVQDWRKAPTGAGQ